MAGGRTDPLRRRARWPRVLLFVLVASGTAILFRQGLVAPVFNPLPLIDLAQPRPWLVDWRLASIKNHPEICARTLKAPHIEAEPIPDSPIKNGCGWHNGVRLVSAAGARAGFDKLTCEAAVALALWLQNEVQPLAKEILGQHVRSLQSYGSYSCRNIIGNTLWRDVRSQHAAANAADIGGFTLADGRSISVRAQWRDETPEGRAPGRLPLLPRRAGAGLQRGAPRSLPFRSRPAFALQVRAALDDRALQRISINIQLCGMRFAPSAKPVKS